MTEPGNIELLKYKRIYTVEGNIGAGKTTILNIIGEKFDDVAFIEEPVKQWQNLNGENLLESFYKDPTRWGFSFEFYSMFSKLKSLVNAAETDKPIIVIERSIMSNKAFGDISYEMGKITPMEYRMLMNTYDFYLKNVYPILSGVIYLDTPVDECIQRICLRNRGEECGIEKDYLETIKQKYDEIIDNTDLKVLTINGRYDLNKDTQKIADMINKFMHPNGSRGISFTD